MILAVLETRAGIQIGQHDVFLNIAGGLRIREPAADLAVAAALLSSLTGTVIPHDTVVFGEVSLSGSVRPVGQTESRLKEAQKLGLAEAVVAGTGEVPAIKGLRIKTMDSVLDLAAWIGGQSRGQRRIA
jgi:DNA repair protein RadA/Sms